MEEHCISIEGGALAVLASAAERFLRFAQDLREAGCQDVLQDDLDVLASAIRAGRQALANEPKPEQAKATHAEARLGQRFVARRLPEPLWLAAHGLGEWEMWDTVEQHRAGKVLFANEQICADYAATWSDAFGPPERCGFCGHVFGDGEQIVGHEYYALLCAQCAAAKGSAR